MPARLSRAFAHALSHALVVFAARFGSYLRSICVSEAEAWTCESSDCPLHLHCTIGTPELDRYHLSTTKCPHSAAQTKDLRCAPPRFFLTSKIRPSNELLRLSECDLCGVVMSQGTPIGQFRAWKGRQCLENAIQKCSIECYYRAMDAARFWS